MLVIWLLADTNWTQLVKRGQSTHCESWSGFGQTMGFLSQNHPWTLWFIIICSHVATNMVMKLTKPHGLTSGNQTRQWRIHSGFSQLVPPFRLASFWPCLISEGQPRLRGAKACSLDWSQVSGCLDRTWTVGKGLPETYHDWGWNRSHQNGWWLGDGIMCVYIYIYYIIYIILYVYIYIHIWYSIVLICH